MPKLGILRVAVNAPLRMLFDYLPPEGLAGGALRPGVRVHVPFGKGRRTGVLLEVAESTDVGRGRLKRVVRILDAAPLLGGEDLALAEWAAAYYQHPIGEVLSGALPLRLRRGERVASDGLPGWRLTAEGAAVDPAGLRGAPRQSAVMAALRRFSGRVSREALYGACGPCGQVLRTLEGKGWVAPCSIDVAELPAVDKIPDDRPLLNPAQAEAVEAVGGSLGAYHSFLLDGVTGSGKTEVYLALIERALAERSQALVLVPEIGLTPQLLERFNRRIREKIVVLHSGMGELERERAWLSARNGTAGVVLGTRSAVFTPLPRLGLVIVDEEHDLSFKQQEGFRYSARDLAVIRGYRCGCPVVLGSATPSLESVDNAARGRYRLLTLPDRAGNASAPSVDLVDIRSAPLEGGLSPVTLRAVRQEISAGNQVLLFLNRRGYAPLLTCHHCGWIAECRRCDARMTLHAATGMLWCHHCGSQRRADPRCPDCSGADLRRLGQGTERLEETLRGLFPDQSVVRIDRDSTRRRGDLERLLDEIKEGKHGLLVGTQMLAKGHHFPDVTLVCILDIDQGLFGTDFRAAERMAQMLIQVAGRAGREEKPGRVMVQTRHPDHPQLQLLVGRGYGAFAEHALAERREAQLPPFSHQALLRAAANGPVAPREFLEAAVEFGEGLAAEGVLFFGPVAAPMERRAGKFRAHLLVQAGARADLQRFLVRWVPGLESMKLSASVRWSIDVDPQDLY